MKYSSLPIEQLQAWATFNGVESQDVTVRANLTSAGGIDKGSGIVATPSLHQDRGANTNLIRVPSDLILSKERVEICAKSDRNLRDLLDAVGDFAVTPKICILIFLLLQLTRSSPDFSEAAVGVASPFTDYVRFLPKAYPLPIFYSDHQRELLRGTSLDDAVHQKLNSLEREFNQLKATTASLPWCQRHWWDEETGHLTFEDWKLVDAMYRSRALDLPTIGHAMVPVIDMANHVSDGKRNARFEVTADGGVMLVKEEDVEMDRDTEISITYGTGGACEMLFSYGFLEENAASAREAFLGVEIPMDDPLRIAKKAVAQGVPGVRIFVDKTGSVEWESNIVWWASINEEDGLDFAVKQSNDGKKELTTLWKNQELLPSSLKEQIMLDDQADVFRLRSIAIIQERVEEQGQLLMSSETNFQQASQHTNSSVWEMLNRLRSLELDLMTGAYEKLDNQKASLLTNSSTVRRYLEKTSSDQRDNGNMEDDFS